MLVLFLLFLFIGLVSFGGGYAMIPFMQTEIVYRYQWLTPLEFTDITAISGMSPGPIATNMAVAIGYFYKGIGGASVAALGMALPSYFIVIGLAYVYKKWKDYPLWNGALYGIRAVVTGFIIYSAILFAKSSEMFSTDIWYTVSQVVIFVGSLASLMIFKKHPVYVIVISGLVGIALYS